MKKITLKSALSDFFTRAFDYKGTSTRYEFWMVMLFYALFLIAVGVFAIVASDGDMETAHAIMLVFALIASIPMFALQARRFQDAGVSGWFVLVFLICGFIPGVGIVAQLAGLVIACLPTKTTDNKYLKSNKQKTSSNKDNTSDVDVLDKAAKMYKQHLISKAEFEKIKKEVLNK